MSRLLASLFVTALGCSGTSLAVPDDAADGAVDASSQQVDAAALDARASADAVAPLDADGCRTARDCNANQQCVYSAPGCGLAGRCAPLTDCAAVATYCGCDGQSFEDCPAAVGQPFAARGACTSLDAGAPPDNGPRCEGAHFDRTRQHCVGPSDQPLPVDCCTGWDCDPSHALCNAVRPRCPEGAISPVVGQCWGPCVPVTACADAGAR